MDFTKDKSLAQFEDTLTGILKNENNDIHIAVTSIETSGCSIDICCESNKNIHKNIIEVILFDLSWISPGPLGRWSDDGQQHYWIKNKTPNTDWYKSVLEDYFKIKNQPSLLSYNDIYEREEFIKVNSLSANSSNKIISNENTNLTSSVKKKIKFKPNPLETIEDSSNSFSSYKTSIQKELKKEISEEYIENMRLAWIYVSSGTKKIGDKVPAWSASIFIVYKFKSSIAKEKENLLLSNLLRFLKNAAYRSLGQGYAMRYFAQTLSHEYKNLNQDIAALSAQIIGCFNNIPPSQRGNQYDDFFDKVQALHFAAQAATAISKAAYLLASPTLTGIYFPATDRAREIFQHIIFLAIHLISITRNNWTLIDIPTLNKTVKLINQDLNLKARSPTDLLSNLCVQLMLFFALEPVRNIRNKSSSKIEVSVNLDSDNKRLIKLIQKLPKQDDDASFLHQSKSISALMQALEDSQIPSFIKIYPITKSTFKENMIERTTIIEVFEQIPFPIS